MKKAFLKDTFREIKNSFGRFMSIFTIVTLGCGFFAGIKATMPDMKQGAELYFEENNLMDLKLSSTIGVKAEDIAAVKSLDIVEGVMAGYSKDVFCNDEGKNSVLRMMSYNNTLDEENVNNINHLVLVEGRLPENPGECVVDKRLSSDTFKIGNTLDIFSANKDEELSDTLARDEFEIVGVVLSPLYIGFERDNTLVGTGTVQGFVYILEEEFVSDYYSEMFLTLKNFDYEPFSDEYRNEVEKAEETVGEVFEESINQRFNDMLTLYENRLSSAEDSVAELENILSLNVDELYELKTSTEAEIADYESKITDESGSYEQAKLSQAKSRLEQLDALIYARTNNDEDVISEYEKQLSEINAQIADSKEQIALMDEPAVLTYTRFSNSDYGSFSGDSEKIDSISKVFPVFFIIVAALVCLTTMTRMVEEQRTQIGTYKALGYSSAKIASKYLIYGSLAALTGSFIGTTIGLQIFPRIIYNCYKMLYNIPEIVTPFKPIYVLCCMAVSVACICFAVIYSCYRELSSQPAALMRPRSPKAGKRVILEKIPFIWNKLDFLAKVTVRNLLRYKKRFLMTVVGVAGCTALILTGLGLRHSITSILDLQYGEIFIYDGMASLNTAEYSVDDCEQVIIDNKNTQSCLKVFQRAGKVSLEGDSQEIYLVVPEKSDEISDYVNLRNPTSKKAIELSDNGAVITQKIANLLDVKAGDTIEVDLDELGKINVKILAITENYAVHYLYMTSSYYEKLVEKPVYNVSFFKCTDGTDTDAYSEEIISSGKVLGISYNADNGENMRKSLNSLDAIVWMLVVCAGILAIVVLYNLANINITERVREIATIKVLGFYDSETSAYIYRENIISAFIGILFGFGVGVILHRFVVLTAEVDLVMFGRTVVWWAYVLSAILTLAFTALVNIILHFKLKRIDMVESLKSVE